MHALRQKLDCTHLFELYNVRMSQLLVVDNFPLHILTDLYNAANLCRAPASHFEHHVARQQSAMTVI